MRFAKGHGTGNDFVIVPDLDGELDLTPELVRALCDRHFGVGGDGVLRVVRSAAVGEHQTTEWFMDYRNADGSVAEMCGNGVRVFVRYLIEEGLVQGPEVAVGTRAGIRTVRSEPDGEFTVDMGGAAVLGDGRVDTGGRVLAGLAISVGNPHLACVIDEPVGAVDLGASRVLAPAELTGGANVEVVRIVGPQQAEMQVHERGSGLTLSCGTGAVAAAVAAAVSAGEWPDVPARWTMHVPGGTLAVTPSVTASLLTGPAEIVARGELDAGWIARQRQPASAGRN
ncbi:MAG: diaminopimelate epimerase [Actinobacteria bacterium]|nr:diaminopimelate epimerase [Actinomycetota bacterium]